jgi:hypothetical protein
MFFEHFDQEAQEEISILVKDLCDDISRISEISQQRLSLEISPLTPSIHLDSATRPQSRKANRARTPSPSRWLKKSAIHSPRDSGGQYNTRKKPQKQLRSTRNETMIFTPLRTLSFDSNFSLSLHCLENIKNLSIAAAQRMSSLVASMMCISEVMFIGTLNTRGILYSVSISFTTSTHLELCCWR